MSEEEFFERAINRICKDYDYNFATEFKLMFLKKDKEIERLNNKEEQIIRRLEDLIIIGEQVENEWAVDICKMIINELKGSDKE